MTARWVRTVRVFRGHPQQLARSPANAHDAALRREFFHGLAPIRIPERSSSVKKLSHSKAS